jgi:hypothetical protein
LAEKVGSSLQFSEPRIVMKDAIDATPANNNNHNKQTKAAAAAAGTRQ